MATENLQIKITAIDKTRQAFNNLGSRLNSMKGAFAAVVASAGLVVAAIFRIGQSIDRLAKVSARIGVTANELRSLRYAAELSGASAEQLDKGMLRFARTISEANVGLSTAKRGFDTLGISIKDQNGTLKSVDALFKEVTQKFTGLSSEADRARVANELFGRSGQELLNMLSSGSEGVDQMRQKFEELTFELTERQTKAVQQANDNLTALKVTFQSFGQLITAEVLPILSDLIVNGFARLNEKIAEGLSFWSKFFSALGVNTEGLDRIIGKTKQLSGSLTSLKDAVEESGTGLLVWYEEVKSNTNPIIEKTTEEIDRLSESYVRLNDKLEGGMLVGEFPAVLKEVSDEMERITEENDRLIAGAGILGAEIPPQYEAAKTALQEYGDAARDVTAQLQGAGVSALQRLEDTLLDLKKGTISVKDAFKSMASSIIDDLIRIQIRKQITGPISDALGSAFSSGGGSIFSKIFGSIFGGGKASGGSVSAGRTYLVGERGPELFAPGASGTIIPNGAAMGGSPVSVNVINNTSATARTEERQGPNGERSIDVIIDETVARNIQRPGSRTGRALRNSFAGLQPQLAGR